jgi:hypothetical protein
MSIILFGISAIKGIINDVEILVKEENNLATGIHIQKEACKVIKRICDAVEKEN